MRLQSPVHAFHSVFYLTVHEQNFFFYSFVVDVNSIALFKELLVLIHQVDFRVLDGLGPTV